MTRLNVILPHFFNILALVFVGLELWTGNPDWGWWALLMLIPSAIVTSIFNRCPHCGGRITPNPFRRRTFYCRHCGSAIEYIK